MSMASEVFIYFENAVVYFGYNNEALPIFPPFLDLTIAGIILVAPGWALATWLPLYKLDLLERLAVSTGLSISITVLAGELAFLLGFHFTAPLVASCYAIALMLAIAGSIKRKRHFGWNWYSSCGLLVLAGLVAWRFYQARSLVLPAWVDSVHHVLVVRKIMETGGLPGDLMPYLAVPFFYHYGFHLLAAAFASLAQIAPAQAVLWIGQIINALVALSIYRLGRAIWNDHTRAGLSALLTGFVLQMPAYYLSWGRYTLLAGMVMLPLAMAEIAEVRQVSALEWKNISRLALFSAGVILCHYLAAVLLALFVLILLAGDLLKVVRKDNLGRGWYWPFVAVAAGGLMVTPWLWRVWSYGQQLASVEVVAIQRQSILQYLNYALSLLGPRRNLVVMGLAFLGLLLALARPKTRALAVWMLLLISLALPWGLRFNPFRPDQVAIILFLPASLLASDLLLSAGEALGAIWRPAGAYVGLGIVVALLLLWGMRETGNFLNPVTVFANAADLQALQWVDDNIPRGARFFINATKWQTASYRGVDGGYWLEPLTGRWSLVPPAMYGWGPAELRHQVNDWAERASHLKTCDEEFWSLVGEADLEYVYLKKGTGGLQPAAVNGCQGLTVIYQKDGVFIFSIDHEAARQ